MRPGRAHILNAEHGARLHHFQAGLQQQFFKERVAHLDIGPLLFRAFGELLARHRCAVDAVAAGLRADVKYRVADPFRLGVENFVFAHETQRERIEQRVAGVAGFETRFSPQVGHAEAVAVPGHAVHHAGKNLPIACVIKGGRRRDEG